MIVIGLDRKEYTWKLPRRIPTNTSKLHKKAKEIIREEFPLCIMYEEVTLPGSGKPSLRADIYLRDFNLIVETNGQQHYEYNSHFNKNKLAFFKAKRNDMNKKEWCYINNIKFLELPYNDGEWRSRIRQACGREITGDSE